MDESPAGNTVLDELGRVMNEYYCMLLTFLPDEVALHFLLQWHKAMVNSPDITGQLRKLKRDCHEIYNEPVSVHSKRFRQLTPRMRHEQ